MSNGERWRPVVGHEGWYEVSDRGRVRSLDRVLADGRRCRGRVLSPLALLSGHRQVTLCGNGRRAPALVHRLVLEAFVGPAPAGHECCHWDGDPTNNALENLRWDTRSENRVDSVRHGTHRNARKSRCPRGHELVEPNLVRALIARGIRSCRACGQARAWLRVSGSTRPFEVVADEKYAAIMGPNGGGPR